MLPIVLRHTLLPILALSSFNAFGQNLLSNGGFENPGFSFTPAPYFLATDDYRYLDSGSNTALADWIVADNGIGQRSFVYHQHRYAVAAGYYGLALDEGTSVTTSFTTSSAGLLNLSLHMTWANGCNCFQPAPLEVIVDGVKVADFSGVASNWRYSDMSPVYSASFSVGAGAHSFTLSNPQLIGDFREYRIDEVTLVAAPVPEPEIAAMMILGFGFMGVVARRRRNYVAG